MNKKYYGLHAATHIFVARLHAVVAAVAACFPTLQHADLTTRITELEPKTRSELPLPY